jgi:predicted metalloprotease with PDZ domain
LRTPGRFWQSVTDSSLDAWTKYYKQDENSPNSIVSYYVKGSLIALCLDLLMRAQSADRVSLDALMRRLWQDFGQRGIGVEADDIPRLAAELCGDNLSAFWENALYGTAELPLADLLTARGLDWILRPAENAADAGGKPGSENPGQPRGWLGARFQNSEGGVALTHVLTDSPAQRAGLSAADVVVAVNGLRVNGGNLEKMLATYAPGAVLTVHAFRRDELMTFTVTLGEVPADTCVLALPAEGDRRYAVEKWILGHS